jgi:pimeloyl-ACP methyl ester carboxylesterase
VKAFACFFRAALIGAVIAAQIAATPPLRPPYNVNLYLHPARLVDIGGRRLNIVCTGQGSPTVILEAGLLADSAAWRLVQPAISRSTRVCSYDRAGLGFSDPAGAPRDAAAIVRDLHALLRVAGIAPPYVLVGWSSGGPYTRLYQYLNPKDVVGLVEVDPDTEFDTLATNAMVVSSVMHKPRAWYDKQGRQLYGQFANCAKNVKRGTCAFFPGPAAYNSRAGACLNGDPAECALAKVRGDHLNRGSLWKDELLELEASDKSNAEVRKAERPYGNLPLIVLTDSEAGDIEYDHPIISIAAQRAMWVAKEKAEARVARLSAMGAHFVVAGSSHAILLDHPSAVISAIDEVLSQARSHLAGISKSKSPTLRFRAFDELRLAEF